LKEKKGWREKGGRNLKPLTEGAGEGEKKGQGPKDYCLKLMGGGGPGGINYGKGGEAEKKSKSWGAGEGGREGGTSATRGKKCQLRESTIIKTLCF